MQLPPPILPGLQAAAQHIQSSRLIHPVFLHGQYSTLSREDYLHALAGLHSYYQALDRRISASYFDYAYRRVASPSVDWLNQDLTFYGHQDETLRCFDLPTTHTLESVLAILFIKEATWRCENRLLSDVKHHLGNEQHSYRYLTGWGDQKSAHAQQVIHYINDTGRLLDQDAIAVCAQQAMDKLYQWLDKSAWQLTDMSAAMTTSGCAA